jgi:hypothetical protein
MKITRFQTILMLFGLAAMCFAQPKLVRFSGSLQPSSGRPARGVESVTLAVYREQSGGAPLWQEVQNAEVDSEGGYSLLMGSTLNEGMPMELFASGEPRWLGVQVNRPGEVEQPRVLLVSVPYALKASDAEMLGGRPASAYLLAEAPANVNSTTGTSAPTGSANTVSTKAVKPRANAGSVNFVGKFVDATNLGNSSIYDINGAVGIGTTTPTANLELSGPANPILRVNGAAPGAAFIFNSQTGMGQDRATMGVNAFFNGNWHLANTQEPSWLLQLRTAEDDFGILRAAPGAVDFANHALFTVKGDGNVGIGTQSPASKLDVAGDINFTGGLFTHGVPILHLGLTGGDPGSVGLGLLTFQNGQSPWSVAVGNSALSSNVGGCCNTAVGNGALSSNTEGFQNTGIGGGRVIAGTGNSIEATLGGNTLGRGNTAVGNSALTFNTTGDFNTAIGLEALRINTMGSDNVAIGRGALSASSGTSNIAIGNNAGAAIGSGALNIDIGALGDAFDDRKIRIGSLAVQTTFFAAGIRGVTTANNDAIPVMIDSAGQLGTVSSSRRLKEDIADMGDASRGLMDLRPVTYRYKQPFADGSKPIQYGLIAEEVAEVYPNLVAHSADGQIETVKYQVLDSMLLNEVQRLRRQNRDLEERLEKLEAALAKFVQ